MNLVRLTIGCVGVAEGGMWVEEDVGWDVVRVGVFEQNKKNAKFEIIS